MLSQEEKEKSVLTAEYFIKMMNNNVNNKNPFPEQVILLYQQ
jgi:hypothetical protein